MASTGINRIWSLIGLIFFFLSPTTHAQSILNGIEEGDLLFVSPLVGNAITDVTQLSDSIVIDHVAICHRIGGDNGLLYVIEAIGDGVSLTPADSFLLHNHDAVIYAARVEGADVTATVKRALGYVGRPYDWLYQSGDSALYCSELVQVCFITVGGKEIFPTIPMTFRDSTGSIPDHWIKLYAQHQKPVPEGESGTNPAQLFRYSAVRTVDFFIPHIVVDVKQNH